MNSKLSRLALLTGLCALLIVAIYAQMRPAPQPPDTIVWRGKIYTENPQQPWAEAVAITAGKIVAVGNSTQILAYRSPTTRLIDAGGRVVLPGFTDSHIHFLDGSLSLTRAELSGVSTVAEIQKRLKQYAATHPGNDWILGQGWTYDVFGETALPDKKYLDEILPDRPVFLECYDGHTTWANSKALQRAGITRDKPDPPNGKIVRDPKTGEATGALKEDASDLIRRILPAPSREEKLTALRLGLATASSAGLVRVHSLGYDFDSLDIFDELRRNGQLTVRMDVADVVEPPELSQAEMAKLEQARARYHDEWLAAGAAKFFLDGVIEAHTAAMLSPYADDARQRGSLFWNPDQYKKAVTTLDAKGFQIFTHAIGDAAVRLALDAYTQAQKINGTGDARHRIEHIETISSEDIPRFGALGVIASFQPLHAYPDTNTLKIWLRNVGPEREPRAFAWRSVAAAGGRLAFGSDWPIVTLNPWHGIENAVTREREDGQPAGGWVPAQRVTLAQAIEAYTLGAAIAGRREKSEGSLEPGKLADLIILSQDIFKVDPHAIGKTEVFLTMVGGRVVYRAPGHPTPDAEQPPTEN